MSPIINNRNSRNNNLTKIGSKYLNMFPIFSSRNNKNRKIVTNIFDS